MKTNKDKPETKTWAQIKDEVYGKKGTTRRDDLTSEVKSLKIDLLLRKEKRTT